MKNNQFERGMAVFAECTARHPHNPEAKYLMGVCAFHLENYPEAIEHFTALLQVEPKYKKNAYLFLGIAQKKTGQWEEALVTVLLS